MQEAPIPANDDARLAELRSYGVLDTPDEDAFDDIGHLIRTIAGTPIGIVSLVDENRQWFKTCIGMQAKETPRVISFCGHTILQRQPLIVEDTREDARFSDNPLVVEGPRIRFYAGFPLVSANGMSLGSLCAVDTEPRRLSATQIDALQRLARQTVKLMELKREGRLLAASEQQRQQLSQGSAQSCNLTLRNAPEVIQMLELMVGEDHQPCLAVLRIGIKDLKRLQSTLGNAAAEQWRHHCNQLLQQLLPSDAHYAWHSDNELIAVLPYVSREEELALLAGTLSQQLEKPVPVGGQLLSSQVAIGIALYKGNYATAEALLADAAIAQQIARSQPGSHFSFIDLATRIQAQQDISLEAALHRALRDGELEPFFQPLVDLRSGAVMGVEALVRWRDAKGSLIEAATVLAAARRAGLTARVDLALIDKAIRASRLIAEALPDQHLLLSLNLSAELLDDPLQRHQLLDLLGREPLPPGWCLQLELIEEALQQSDTHLVEFLNDLRDRNVLVAIDDFGTGYSSLSRLHNTPLHALKIDGSFVRRIQDPDKPSDHLLTLMQQMGHDLGLHTTAEGIETDQQRLWLHEHDFDWGQGYLFAKPMSLEMVIAYLKEYPSELTIQA
jgi:EAL domain-containing protein (putative c-di-GMP-specific phosphodiesterase class I)/GAF domain-containing protein